MFVTALSLLTGSLASSGKGVSFHYILFSILLAFLILVPFHLCIPSVFSYLQMREKKRGSDWLRVTKVKIGKDVT